MQSISKPHQALYVVDARIHNVHKLVAHVEPDALVMFVDESMEGAQAVLYGLARLGGRKKLVVYGFGEATGARLGTLLSG